MNFDINFKTNLKKSCFDINENESLMFIWAGVCVCVCGGGGGGVIFRVLPSFYIIQRWHHLYKEERISVGAISIFMNM